MSPAYDADLGLARDRAVALAGLEQAWEAVSRAPVFSGTRRLVVVKSQPGMGATTLLRGLYQISAADCPGYWPRQLGAASSGPGGDSVYPHLLVEREAAIPYLWWFLAGAEERSAAVDAALQVEEHLKPIRQLMDQAAAALPPRAGKAVDYASVVTGLLSLVPGLNVVTPIDAALTIADPILLGRQAAAALPSRAGKAVAYASVATGLLSTVLGLDVVTPIAAVFTIADAILLGQQAARDWREASRRRAGPDRARPLDLRRDSVNAAQLQGLLDLVRGAAQLLPVVVAVDHADLLDRGSAQLLADLLGSDGARVLVVLAVDETNERFDQPARMGLAPLVAWAEGRGIKRSWWGPGGAGRVPPEPPGPAARAAAEGYRLGPLAAEAMKAVALDVLRPRADAELNDAVLSRLLTAAAGSPGALRDLLARPALAAAALNPVAADPGPLDPGAGGLEEALDRMPQRVAQPLAVAALLGLTAPLDWLRDACEMAGVDPAGLAEADWLVWEGAAPGQEPFRVDPPGWAEPDSEPCAEGRLVRFATPAAHEAALDRAFRSAEPALLTPDEREAVWGELYRQVERGYDSDWAEVPERVAFEALRAVSDERWLKDVPRQWREDYLGFAAERRTIEAEELLGLVQQRLGHPPLWLLNRTTEALVEAGLHALAVDCWRARAKQARKAAGPGSDLHLDVLGNVAALLARQARDLLHHHPAPARDLHAQAVEAYQAVLEAAAERPTAEAALAALEQLARLHEDFRLFAEARDTAQTLADRLAADPHFGQGHPRALAARGNLAYCTAEAGQFCEALRLYRELLPDTAAEFDHFHPNTLTTRAQIAHCTGKTGDHQRALDLFLELLPDQALELGHHHRRTLNTRSNIARLTGETSDSQGALDLYQKLLPDQTKALGPLHPDTLTTRAEIAARMYETGEHRRALALYLELLPDRVRALGPFHPDTLDTRSNIAYCTGKANGPQAALGLYLEVLQCRSEGLGPHHPDTLTTRANIAACTGETGDHSRALALYLELLPDQAKALGPLDPQTLKTRAGIAYYTSETGHSQEALHLYQKLLPDQTKALDPLNYNTLAIRVNIASLTEITGDPDGALCLLRELLPDQVAAFGEDSHLVARTRSAIERLEGELEGGG